MEAEHQLGTVEQWYDRAIAINRNWREEERLREQKVLTPRTNRKVSR